MNDQMNVNEKTTMFRWGSRVLIVLSIFLAIQALGALKSLGNPDPIYNSISVVGEGEVLSIPDIATFSFTVSADAQAVSDAQNKVTEKMDAILGALKDLGIEDKDVKTTDYSVWPKYTYVPVACTATYCPPSRQVPDGYSTSHNISLKVRDTAKVGEALAVVGESGATNISSVTFTTEDSDELIAEARAKAIEDAKNKARVLAEDLDVRLVRVMGFYENMDGGPRMYYETLGMGGDMQKSVSAPSLPSGENKTVVNVTVTYEIR